jgi:matrixin
MSLMSWAHGRAVALYGACVILGTAAACGGGSSPAPTPTPTPTPQPQNWSVSGHVTGQTGSGIGGATVAPNGVAAVQSDGAGAYKFSGTGAFSAEYAIQITAPGFLNRKVWANWAMADRTGVDVNMISTAAPFSLPFYQELARNGFEEPGHLEPLYLWPGGNPKVYVRTVDQNGKAIEPEVLSGVYAVIPRAIQDWTGGKLSLDTLEHGTATRDRQDGWIVVNFTHDYSRNICGQSYVGALDGEITLVDDICSCGSNKMPGQVVAHEFGHALGFFHVSNPAALMYPQIAGCPPGALSSSERYHARVAYSRTAGNTDPDTDPAGAIPLSRRDVLIVN